jgi:undecaprenyl-diphosphatase
MARWLGRLDQATIRAVRNGRRPAWVTVARAVSALAEPAFCGPLLAACAVTTASRVGWRRACAPCLVVASGAAARRALSKAVARPRPPAEVWLAEPEGFSLPSKHTTLAALTVGACAGSLGAGGPMRYGLPLLAAAGTGASRVYLGVHWPSDILAAWLFAEGWLRLSESVLPTSGGHSPHWHPVATLRD